MKFCTFFGHRDCPDSIRPILLKTVKERIADGITGFYVGNQGIFDAMALSCLRELKAVHPEITYAVVLAYLPTENGICAPGETILPDGIENVPARFAIDYRNRWMLDRADTVISYIVRPWGGAAKYVEIAERKGKNVIRI